jgi:transposase
MPSSGGVHPIEYRAGHPEGYGYSRFCDLFREFEGRLSPVMRQEHRAGDKVFVDYSGKKIGITDPTTGPVREAEIFVAVLGASNYTYAEASWSQALPDWIGAHVRMFRAFGGVPRLAVPDIRLKRLLADAMLDNAVLKDIASKKW